MHLRKSIEGISPKTLPLRKAFELTCSLAEWNLWGLWLKWLLSSYLGLIWSDTYHFRIYSISVEPIWLGQIKMPNYEEDFGYKRRYDRKRRHRHSSDGSCSSSTRKKSISRNRSRSPYLRRQRRYRGSSGTRALRRSYDRAVRLKEYYEKVRILPSVAFNAKQTMVFEGRQLVDISACRWTILIWAQLNNSNCQILPRFSVLSNQSF